MKRGRNYDNNSDNSDNNNEEEEYSEEVKSELITEKTIRSFKLKGGSVRYIGGGKYNIRIIIRWFCRSPIKNFNSTF